MFLKHFSEITRLEVRESIAFILSLSENGRKVLLFFAYAGIVAVCELYPENLLI